MKYSSLLNKLTPFLSLLLFIAVVWILKQELGSYNFTDITTDIARISQRNIYLAIVLTFLGYFIISLYDKIALAYLKYSLPVQKILTTAFISYAVCNTTGFALLIGGGIRYYFYGNYRVPRKVITQIIAFSNLNFWLGLLAVGGLTFIFDPLNIPELVHLRFATVRPIGLIFLVIVSVYLYYSWQRKSFKIKGHSFPALKRRGLRMTAFRGQTFIIPSLSISLSQIVISAGDWAIASAVLYILLPSHTNLPYWSFFGIYLLGITAGIISNIPGGLGVFETIILYLLPTQVTASEALGSLLAYRGIYFLLPLFVALAWWVIYEIQKRLFLK